MGVGSFAIGAAQSVAGFEQSSLSAARQNELAAANYQSTVQALSNTYMGENQEVAQERAAGDQQLLQANIKGAKAEGAAITAGGQAGIDGSASLSGVLQDYDQQRAAQSSAIDQNFQASYSNTEQRGLAAQSQGQREVNSMPTATPPSILSAGLGILGAGVSGAATYERDSYLSHPWNNPTSGLVQSPGTY